MISLCSLLFLPLPIPVRQFLCRGKSFMGGEMILPGSTHPSSHHPHPPEKQSPYHSLAGLAGLFRPSVNTLGSCPIFTSLCSTPLGSWTLLPETKVLSGHVRQSSEMVVYLPGAAGGHLSQEGFLIALPKLLGPSVPEAMNFSATNKFQPPPPPPFFLS